MHVSSPRFQGVYKLVFQEKPGNRLEDHPVFRKWPEGPRESLKARLEEMLYRKLMEGTAQIAMQKPGFDFNPSSFGYDSLFEAGGVREPNKIWLMTDDAQGNHATQLGNLSKMASYRGSTALAAFKQFREQLSSLAFRNPEIRVEYEVEYPNSMEYDPTGLNPTYANWIQQMGRNRELRLKDWLVTTTPPVDMPRRNPFTESGVFNPDKLDVIGPDSPI